MFTNCLIMFSDCTVLVRALGEEVNNQDNSKVMVTEVEKVGKNCMFILDVLQSPKM